MTVEIRIPDIGMDEVEVTEILVNVGDKIITEQSILVVEGDKASIEIPSPFTGMVKEIKVKVGDKVSTGSLIMISEIDNTDYTENITERETFSVDIAEKVEDNKLNQKHNTIHATPLIRRLARELDIDLTEVKGTGRKGRILREDIQAHVKEVITSTDTSQFHHVKDKSVLTRRLPSQSKFDFTKFGEVEEIELNRIQKISGSNLSRNWMTIPHVTHFDKVDITDLEVFRKHQNYEIEKCKNTKITLIAFIIKAVAAALERMPRFNSSLSDDSQKLILKKYINIGVAVDTIHGLVVPVFKNINKKGIIELSHELVTIFKKARDGKLTIGEMQGGCFTISSIGSLGTTNFTPIVNAPEVAILGISKSSMESVWNGEKFIPRLMLPISLSFDHRVIDGADGARFITIISNNLSDIRRLIM